MEKSKSWHNALSSPMNILFGMTMGYLASTYSMWILVLGIPYGFQLTFAILFKHKR